MVLKSLEFDEIDELPLSLDEVIRNINIRATSYSEGKWDHYFGITKIQFRNISVEGNTLIIRKVGQFRRNNLDFYRSTSGTIHVTMEAAGDKTKFRAIVKPEIILEKTITIFAVVVLSNIVALNVQVFSTAIFGLIVLCGILLSLGLLAFIDREARLALRRYYKAYLFNIVNT